MEDVKGYLNEDANEEERQAAEQVSEGLATLRLQKKVKAVATERASRNRRNSWWRATLTLLLLLAAGLSWLWVNNTKEEVSDSPTIDSTPPPPPIFPDTPIIEPIGDPINTPSEEQEDKEVEKAPEINKPATNLPIAQADPVLPPPAYSAPATYLRGQNEEQENKVLIDQLWYTSYPLQGLKPGDKFSAVDQLLRERRFSTAYVRLQRLDRQSTSSDTLRYLQAYTLLEMGQGEEASLLMSQISKPPKAWLPQLTWYQGLAALLADDKTAALAVFRGLAAQPEHPYYLQAKKAIELYE